MSKKRLIIYIIAFLIAFVLFILELWFNNLKNKNISVEEIKVNDSTIYLKYAERYKLNATVLPENATNKLVTWSSSDSSLVEVDNEGNITVIKNEDGEVIITAKTVDGDKTAEVKVKVTKVDTIVKTTGIDTDVKEITLNYKEKKKITATVLPENATNKLVTWSSSDSSLVEVDNEGNITAVKNVDGEALITAKTVDGGYTAEIKVKVTKVDTVVKTTGIETNVKEITLNYKEKKKITATVLPENATNKIVTWISSDSSLVGVDNEGNITAIKNVDGEAIITAKTVDGAHATKVKVKVKKISISPTSISLNSQKQEIYLNSKVLTTKLTATVYPNDATDKIVTWSSSNSSVAVVDMNGLVTALTPGNSTITATTSNGKKATFQLSVKKKIIIVTGASQVVRMSEDKADSYSSVNYNYSKEDGSLIYVARNGTGMGYQSVIVNDDLESTLQKKYNYTESANGKGWELIQEIIEGYSIVKDYVDFYVFFPLVGNTIMTYPCNEITSSDERLLNYANRYNNSIALVKSNGYNVNGYVVSMHPVNVAQRKGREIVVNEDPNSCTGKGIVNFAPLGFRSNLKYYTFNKAFKSIVQNRYSNNLKYLETFNQIMKVNEEGKNFSYKMNYITTDGVHWNPETTVMYVKLMLDTCKEL